MDRSGLSQSDKIDELTRNIQLLNESILEIQRLSQESSENNSEASWRLRRSLENIQKIADQNSDLNQFDFSQDFSIFTPKKKLKIEEGKIRKYQKNIFNFASALPFFRKKYRRYIFLKKFFFKNFTSIRLSF